MNQSNVGNLRSGAHSAALSLFTKGVWLMADLTDQVFGKLWVTKHKNDVCDCDCYCGSRVHVATDDLIDGRITACPICAAQKRKEELNATQPMVVREANKYIGKHKNKSGVIGVGWDGANKRWVAQISIRGRNIYLGSSRDLNKAIKLRREGESKYIISDREVIQ